MMKKFIQKNTLISILGFISILISISYAITYKMPDYFGIEGWYSLFNNISISYIAALIFFVLQVYKPECENSKRAQMIMNPLFLDLIKFIEITIACSRKFVSINENNVLTIDWYNKEQKIIYFVPVIEGSSVSHRPAIKKTKKDIIALENIFKAKIKEMKARIDFRECSPDILNAISKIEADDFYQSTLIPALMFDGTFVKYQGFHKGVDHFEELKDELKKYCGITDKYAVRDAEDMEIATYEAIYTEKALQAKSVDEFNEITFKKYLDSQLKSAFPDEKLRNEIIDIIVPNVLKNIKN